MQWLRDMTAALEKWAIDLLGKAGFAIDYARGMGIEKDQLFLIFVGGGIAVLLVLIIIVMLIARSGRKKAGNPLPEQARRDPSPPPATDETGRNTRKTREAPSFGEKTSFADQAAAGMREQELADIESEMLALRELYDAGRIDAAVYLEETKALYERARSLS